MRSERYKPMEHCRSINYVSGCKLPYPNRSIGMVNCTKQIGWISSFVYLVLNLVACNLYGATPSPLSTETTALPSPSVSIVTPTSTCYDCIVIQGISIRAHFEIVIEGTSTLADGTCIQTRLFSGTEPQQWWPADLCATLQGGKWKLAISLDEIENAPDRLGESEIYKVLAWQQGNPSVYSEPFVFEFIGPPTPAQNE